MADKYLNFYENLKEAQMRLRSTIVCYDSVPYYVLAITNHNPDGVFRIYLCPLDRPQGSAYPSTDNFNWEDPALGSYMDQWMTAHPTSGIIRKQMDSSYFNKYRPFPLGMCNSGTRTFYLERQPQRNREQGLTRSMISETAITTSRKSDGSRPSINIELHSAAFKACVMAQHPSAGECLTALLDPTVENEAAAFHRHFALVRGPIEMTFLAYKTDVIAVLPKNDFEHLKLGRRFRHCREAIEELKIFTSIN